MKPNRERSFPSEFADLARYNDEVTHGVVHTSIYIEKMQMLQAAFDARHRPKP